jgi:hypothetical protein
VREECTWERQVEKPGRLGQYELVKREAWLGMGVVPWGGYESFY